MIEDSEVQVDAPESAPVTGPDALVTHTAKSVLDRIEAVLEAVGHIPAEVASWVKAEVAKLRSEL